MNLSAFSGGLMLLAVAGIWLWVFVPSWKNQSVARERQAARKSNLRDSANSERKRMDSIPKVKLAGQARRAKLTQRVTGVLVAASGLVMLWSISVSSEFDAWWVVSLSALAAIGMFGSVNYFAGVALRRAVEKAKSVRRPSSKFYAPGTVVSVAAEESQSLSNQRVWSASGVPSQLYRAVDGILENPEIAEVVDLVESANKKASENVVSSETSSINIDEILRRRRANG